MFDYVACAHRRKRSPKTTRSGFGACSSSGDGRRVSEENLIAAVEASHHRLIDRLLLRRLLRLLLLLLKRVIPIRRVRIRRIRPTSVRIIRVTGEPYLAPSGRSSAEPQEAPVEQERAPRRPQPVASLHRLLIQRRHERLVPTPAPGGGRQRRRYGRRGRCSAIARSFRQVVIIVVVVIVLLSPLRLATAEGATTSDASVAKGRRGGQLLRSSWTGRRLAAAA